jgi:hypothetical protein
MLTPIVKDSYVNQSYITVLLYSTLQSSTTVFGDVPAIAELLNASICKSHRQGSGKGIEIR